MDQDIGAEEHAFEDKAHSNLDSMVSSIEQKLKNGKQMEASYETKSQESMSDKIAKDATGAQEHP